MIDLSVIIPTYNEACRIANTLTSIIQYLRKLEYEYEVIVSDDGSKDETTKQVEGIAQIDKRVSLLKNVHRGKGAAVKNGILRSKGRYILFLDADLSTPIEELEKLLKLLEEKYDIVIGSRALPESDIRIHRPWYREIMGKIFNLFVQAILMKGIKDTQCGFMCFKREAAFDIFKEQKLNGFCFAVEVLYVAHKKGYHIKETPICWYNCPDTKVRPFIDSWQMFIDLIKVKAIYGRPERVKSWKEPAPNIL